MSAPYEVIVVGATGLCGSAFVRQFAKTEAVDKVWAISRRPLPEAALTSVPEASSHKIVKEVIPDSNNWGASFPKGAAAILSGVAITRSAAGGLDKQYLIDHDLQLRLAKEAKASGCKAFVLVSSTGAKKGSWMPYLDMKGKVEEDIAAVGFEKTLILRPGPLLGDRTQKHDGFGSNVIERVLPAFHRRWLQRLVSYPVYADEVAEAALNLLSTLPDGVHYIESSEILSASRS